MRIQLLRPPPITVRLDRDYRIEPVWMAALDSAWSTGAEILDAPWPRAIAQALLRDGFAEALAAP